MGQHHELYVYRKLRRSKTSGILVLMQFETIQRIDTLDVRDPGSGDVNDDRNNYPGQNRVL